MQMFNEEELDDLAADLTTAWWDDLMKQDARYKARMATEEAQRKREEAQRQLEKRRTRSEAEQIFAQYFRRKVPVVVVKRQPRG